jgi:hypothetical protein
MNAKGLYYKNMTRIEQDHDKNTYPKLLLNKLKKCEIIPLSIPIGHLGQGSFKKNFQPMLTKNELRFNYELTKS